MTAVAYLDAAPRTSVGFNPLRDKSYQQTRLGRDIADFLAWKELGGASQRTLEQYERDLARAALMFPDKGMADLDDGDATHIARSFSPKQRRVRVAAFRSFFKWGVQQRRCDRNPFDTLPTIKRQPQKVYDLFSEAEIAALTSLPIRDGALAQLMFDAGPRKGDCRKFQVHHYRPESTLDAPYGMLVFQGGKGGKDRQVPATELVAQKLNELILLEGLGPRDHLWYTQHANPVSRKTLRTSPAGEGSFARWWILTLIAAGVATPVPAHDCPICQKGRFVPCTRHLSGYRNPHMTRHTFATRYLRGAFSGGRPGRLETLQLVLGHESIQTTSDLYGHLDTRDVAIDMGILVER